MENSTRLYLTALQQDGEKFPGIVAQIESIGRKWVVIASGYSEQYVNGYVNRKQGSLKLENAIIQTLPKALELKHQHQNEPLKQALDEANKSLERAQQIQQSRQAELKKISHFLQDFEQTVLS